MAASKKNELATTDAKSFDLQIMEGDAAEAIAEEMDGLGTIPYDRVKMPSGGSTVFEIPTEDEDNPDVSKELVGVILYHHPMNTYWAEQYSGNNAPPDCAAMDGKCGLVKETGERRTCEACPHNQFGTGPNGIGKACKNLRRLYILRGGNPIPVVFTLTATSLKSFKNYLAKSILLRGMRCYDVITKMTLTKDTSTGGITYSKVQFSMAGKLSEEQRALTAAMAESLKVASKSLEASSEDYNISDGGEGFVDVSSDNGDSLPFK